MADDKEGTDYRLEWKTIRSDWPVWIVLAGLMALAVSIYPYLPAKVPSHWNIHGEIDRYSSRAFGAFFLPLLNAGMYVLMLVLPLIDPKRENYARFAGAYRLFRLALVLVLGIMYLVTILVVFGYHIDVGLVVKGVIAVLFIIIGNIFGQLKYNFFVGIRTPWTLASEKVWQQTHRAASRVWVLGGLFCLAMASVQAIWSAYLYFLAVAVIVLFSIIYSYFCFKQQKEHGPI